MVKEIKKKILKALEPQKKFLVSWGEEVYYQKEVMGTSENEVRDRFFDGKILPEDKHITDCQILDEGVEVEEA